LLLRMPEALHAQLASAADRAGMSLNQLITTTLAESLGQGRIPTPEQQSEPEEPQPDDRRGKWFTALLVVNLVVVAVAGVLAILLLASAWGG
jgi:HicB-like protein involved in pilus formation